MGSLSLVFEISHVKNGVVKVNILKKDYSFLYVFLDNLSTKTVTTNVIILSLMLDILVVIT